MAAINALVGEICDANLTCQAAAALLQAAPNKDVPSAVEARENYYSGYVRLGRATRALAELVAGSDLQ